MQMSLEMMDGKRDPIVILRIDGEDLLEFIESPSFEPGITSILSEIDVPRSTIKFFLQKNVQLLLLKSFFRLIPCAVLLVGLFFLPESLRWLAKIGKQKEFEAALRKLRGKDADVSEEANEIQDYIETLQNLPNAGLFDLFQRRYLRSATIGVELMVCQQFGGINGICFYTGSIFESAGFPADIGTIIYAILQVIITALNALFVDKYHY